MLNPSSLKLMCWKQGKLYIHTEKGLQPYTMVKGHIPTEFDQKMSKGFRTMQMFLKQGFTLLNESDPRLRQCSHRP